MVPWDIPANRHSPEPNIAPETHEVVPKRIARRPSLGSIMKTIKRRPSMDSASTIDKSGVAASSTHSARTEESYPEKKMARRPSFGKSMKRLVGRRPSMDNSVNTNATSGNPHTHQPIDPISEPSSKKSHPQTTSQRRSSLKEGTSSGRAPLTRSNSLLDTKSVHSSKKVPQVQHGGSPQPKMKNKIAINIHEAIQEEPLGDQSPAGLTRPVDVVDAWTPVRVASEITMTVDDLDDEVPNKTVAKEPSIRNQGHNKSAFSVNKRGSNRASRQHSWSKPQLSQDENHWLSQYKKQEIEYAALYLHSEHLVKELQETTKLLEQESDAAKELEDEFLNMELDLSETRMVRDRLERENTSLRKVIARRDEDYARIEKELHELRLARKLEELDMESSGVHVTKKGNAELSAQPPTPRRSTMSHVPSEKPTRSVSPRSQRRFSLQMAQQAAEETLTYTSSENLHDSLLDSLQSLSTELGNGHQSQGSPFLPPLHPKRRPSAVM